MFGGIDGAKTDDRVDPVSAPPLSNRERLQGEKDALGLYLTGHPIGDYEHELRFFLQT